MPISRRQLIEGACLSGAGILASAKSLEYITSNASLDRASTNSLEVKDLQSAATSREIQPMLIGSNMSFVNFASSQHPFVDRVRTASAFKGINRDYNEVDLDGAELDESGWPVSLPDHLIGFRVYVDGRGDNGDQPRRFVVYQSGAGTLSTSGREISRSKEMHISELPTSSPESQRLAVTVIGFQSDKPARFRVAREDQKDLLLASVTFNPEFIQMMKRYSGGVRFMDWSETNGNISRNWSDRSKASFYSWSRPRQGVPFEVQLQLAKTINTPSWFCIPQAATDEYVDEFLNMLVSEVRDDAIFYLELSNERWNFAGGFTAYHYFEQEAKRRAQSLNWNGYQFGGYRAAQIAKKAADVFRAAGKRSNLINVMGMHSGYPAVQDMNIEGATFKGGSGLAPTNISHIKEVFDAYACTTYFGGGLNFRHMENRSSLLRMMRSGEEGIKNAFTQLRTGGRMPFVPEGSDGDTLDALCVRLDRLKVVAEREGLRLIAYEGGTHILPYPSGGYDGLSESEYQENITWLNGLHQHPLMNSLYKEWIDRCSEKGVEITFHYTNVGRSSHYGFFGALDYTGQESSPRFDALTNFSAKTS